ncbi:hypothetical protein SAMD00024442_25_37 [Candidatus Symbiothrix dinenymphae]|nr:hypothetical protein SAMD00024442_25_37 [Candidatus Symbiothrix dinenymphae]
MATQKIIRYGKSMFDVLSIKSDFFNENEVHLNEMRRIAAIYKQQPARTQCKICGTKLPTQKYFTSHTIDYFLCCCCGHLNGHHEDTKRFADEIYLDQYGKNYIAKADTTQHNTTQHNTTQHNTTHYTTRLDSVYMPKAKFLKDSLQTLGIDYSKFEFLDVGAGSGYMVGALQRLGLSASGIEVSEQQVEYGNRMLEGDYLSVREQDDIANTVLTTTAQVLCFIGVLEHISDLTTMLENIRKNKNIEYVFFSVPMVSLSCIIESIFPDVFNRQLGGTHTHLFTKQSLEWMYANYGFIPQAKWHFGTDIMDIYRSIVVMLKKNNPNMDIIQDVSDIFKRNADGMQLLLDCSEYASEIHVLVKAHQ